MLTGYDIDSVMTAGFTPTAEDVVISGRTFAEYDGVARADRPDLPLSAHPWSQAPTATGTTPDASKPR